MRFGELPTWAFELSDSIREGVISSCHGALDPLEPESYTGQNEVCPFPSDILWREPLFDQLIVNVYHPGEVRKRLWPCQWLIYVALMKFLTKRNTNVN